MLKQAGHIPFEQPLIKATLIQRYKRFLADVRLADGSEITVHCPNPGAMTGLKDPGSTVWILGSCNPKRKLRYTLELIETDGGLVGINTNRPNRIAEAAISAGLVPELQPGPDYTLRREVKYGENSRIDLLFEPVSDHDRDKPITFIEIKNVHLRRPEVDDGRIAEFPDSVTKRGAKHLDELANQVAAGHRAVMLYVIQRMDCDRFALAADIDPDYAAAFTRARNAGVEMLAYQCDIDLTGTILGKRLAVMPVVD